MEQALLDRIYEAAIVADTWPTVLESIGQAVGALGGLLFSASEFGVTGMASPTVAKFRAEFVAAGWDDGNDRVERLIHRNHAGFLTEMDLYPEGDLDELPVRKEFLIPRGLIAADATMIQGVSRDTIILSIEGFHTHASARAAVPLLDELRPHLARAGALSAQLRLERAKAAVASLEIIGCSAAMIGSRKNLIAVNRLFNQQLGRGLHDTPGGLRLSDPKGDQLLSACLERLKQRKGAGQSIAIGSADGDGHRVLHIVPVTGAARDIFLGVSAILLVVEPRASLNSPPAELLQSLYDLTAAEARIARGIVTGAALNHVAHELGVSPQTARTHLKRIFVKLGVSRQAELITLLSHAAPP